MLVGAGWIGLGRPVPMLAALFKPFPEKAPTEFGPRGTHFGIG
jgi:hypothetical protein